MHTKKLLLFSIAFLTITALALNAPTGAMRAKSRLMTLEEIRSFEPGFGCEEHCATEGTTCGGVENVDCCVYSAVPACEFEAQAEECVETGCGGLFDPCDKECIPDDEADCGRDAIVACIANRCWLFYVFDWNGPVVYGGTNCYDMFQCHTVDN